MKGSKKQSQSTEFSVPGMDLGQLERLLSFMSEHGLEEFEYERDGVRIRLRKPSAHVQGRSRSVTTTEDTAYGAPETQRTTGQTSLPVRENAAEKTTAESLHVVKSPIVGTFYASASPEIASTARSR